MYGKYARSGIACIENHAEALRRWESIKPIRGRVTDDRPIGMRRKTNMLIRKNDDGSVACVLYKTDVVTFFPDNKVRVSVPEVWRSGTTAQFIVDVLGGYRVAAGVKDHDVVMAIKGDDARYLRAGENTIFEVAQGGSLKLLSNDRVHTVLTVNRKEMNAVRKSIAAFNKYAMGAMKLREGEVPLEQAEETVAYLVRNGLLEGDTSAEYEWYERPAWSLVVPNFTWYNRAVKNSKLLRTYRFFIDRAMSGDHEDWNHLTCWLLMSSGRYFSRDKVYVASPSEVKRQLDEILMSTHPQVLDETPESRDRIQVNRYRYIAPFRELVKETT